jgi:hypothetical protein
MVRKINKLALQHILVSIRLCQNLKFIRVQKMSWDIEILKIDSSYKKLCKRCIKLWTMYDHTLLDCSTHTNQPSLTRTDWLLFKPAPRVSLPIPHPAPNRLPCPFCPTHSVIHLAAAPIDRRRHRRDPPVMRRRRWWRWRRSHLWSQRRGGRGVGLIHTGVWRWSWRLG